MSDKEVIDNRKSIGDGLAHIGQGLGWFGFWLMLGMSNFGDSTVVERVSSYGESVITSEEEEQPLE